LLRPCIDPFGPGSFPESPRFMWLKVVPRDESFEFPRLSHPSNATGAGLGSPPPRPSDNASRRDCELPRTTTSSGLPAMEFRVASNPTSYQRPRRFSNSELPRSPISPVAPFDASLELPPVLAPSGLAGDRSSSRPEARILQHRLARPPRVCPAASCVQAMPADAFSGCPVPAPSGCAGDGSSSYPESLVLRRLRCLCPRLPVNSVGSGCAS
jgi:hypothetical protein